MLLKAGNTCTIFQSKRFLSSALISLFRYETSRRVTGNGPFIDLPQIEPFDSHDKGQRLQLPPGSSINTRLDSMVYLSNDFEGITRNVKTLCDTIWYQEVKLSSSNTLLYSFDLSECSNLALVEVKKGDAWNLKSSDHLAGWAGYDLQFEETKAGLLLRGNGFFVARGVGLIYQLELKEDQQLLVRSNSLLGTSANIQNISPIQTTNHGAISGRLSDIGVKVQAVFDGFKWVLSKMKKNLNFEQANLWILPQKWESYFVLRLPAIKKNSYYTVQGPGVVILQSNVS